MGGGGKHSKNNYKLLQEIDTYQNIRIINLI